MSPLGLSAVLLSPAIPHAVGSRAVRVFRRHGSHDVHETAGLFVRVRVLQPLAAGVAARSHGGWGDVSGAGAGGGKSTGGCPPAST